MGRTVADVALLLGVLGGARSPRDPLHRPIDLPARLDPPDRPLRVAWSRDIGGAAIDPTRSPCSTPSARRSKGSAGRSSTTSPTSAAPTSASGRCGRGSRPPARRSGSARGPSSSRRRSATRSGAGNELTAAEVAAAYEHLGVLVRRSAEFFSRYDLLVGPVTQLAPFPVEWEYPTEVGGAPVRSYIDWMAVCYRVTVMGCPALSLPAGFDADGLPVGIQLVGAPGGDVDVLRAAATLEAASGHGLRRPPVAGDDRSELRGAGRPGRRLRRPPGDRRPGRVVVVRRRRPRRRRARRRPRTAATTRAPGWPSSPRRATTSSSPCSPAGTPARSPCRSTRRIPTPSCSTPSRTAAPRPSSPPTTTARSPGAGRRRRGRIAVVGVDETGATAPSAHAARTSRR